MVKYRFAGKYECTTPILPSDPAVRLPAAHNALAQIEKTPKYRPAGGGAYAACPQVILLQILPRPFRLGPAQCLTLLWC